MGGEGRRRGQRRGVGVRYAGCFRNAHGRHGPMHGRMLRFVGDIRFPFPRCCHAPVFAFHYDQYTVCLAASAVRPDATRHNQRWGEGAGVAATSQEYVDARENAIPPGITKCLCRLVLCCQRPIGRPATALRSNPKPVISQAPPHLGKEVEAESPVLPAPSLPQTGPF